MKKKEKTAFLCTNCGENFPKWHGRCHNCGEWDTITEFKQRGKNQNIQTALQTEFDCQSDVVNLSTYNPADIKRLYTGFQEVDRVLGGGIVPGSAILIGGSPGIGKSTLMLHITTHFAHNQDNVLYVSGEESLEQISLRAKRLNIGNVPVNILNETHAEYIIEKIDNIKPSLAIIDSIQTTYSEELEGAPGSVSQVRDCASLFIRYAKKNQLSLIFVGHVTKDGSIAGPRILEHMVDTVLYFEGDSSYQYRLLRAVKNRFGPSGEISLFSMSDSGLKEIKNASEFFLMHRDSPQVGTSIVPVLEGSRILVVELQALVNPSHFGLPQRVASGINPKKLSLILAILERYTGLTFGDHDIFFNITGGLSISEPALDLGIAAALISSFRNAPIRDGFAFLGELGLGGEIRPVNSMGQRLKELISMGFSTCVVSRAKSNSDWLKMSSGIDLIQCKTIREISDNIF
ncbi:MAG: DNA repair protein RadA [Chitinispirillia bacterium]|jgi:DNA repair protein RadA/Sms